VFRSDLAHNLSSSFPHTHIRKRVTSFCVTCVTWRGTITPLDGGYKIDGTGGWLLFTTVENSSPAGVLQPAYTTGHVKVIVDSNGNTASYELNGRSTDVCAALS
jgi:hypothetical protein